MAELEHDWVVNFDDHEGVFVCTNALPMNWEQVQIIRAFGTYQFLHSPDPETLAFRHETGVMIAYDGAVVAITYADEGLSLTEALSDLFCVLSGLGWRQVDAFHPMATMEAFMGDVGHAIPAALHDFDVRPATMGSSIGNAPEGSQLIKHAQKLFGSPEVNAGNVLHDTFASLTLGDPVFDDDVSVDPSFLSQSGGAGESDDMSHLFHDDEPQFQENGSAHTSTLVEDHVELPSHTFDDVFSGEPAHEEVLVSEQKQPVVPGVLESLVVIQPVKEVPIPTPQDHKPTALPQVKVMAKVEDTPNNRLSNVIEMVSMGGLASPAMIKVGRSVVFFDCPGQRMDEEAIRTSMVEIGLQNALMTHLYPGSINGAIRWDVLGEIGDNSWFAEVLAAMMVPKADCAFAAALLQALRKRSGMSCLRDLVSVANYLDSEVVELFAGASSGAENLYEYARKRGRVSVVMDELVARVGCLALVPVGGAFVDMVNTENAREMGIQMPETLTMREIAYSGEARAYVVHVSELDSPFVVWLTEVLGHIAVIYSSVKPAVEAVVDVPVDPGQAAVNAQVSKILGPVFAQLKAAGINVSSMM